MLKVLKIHYIYFDAVDCGDLPIMLNSATTRERTEQGEEVTYYCDDDHYMPQSNTTVFTVYCTIGSETWLPEVVDDKCVCKRQSTTCMYFT